MRRFSGSEIALLFGMALAIGLAGCSSDPAAPPVDTTPPSVVGVTATDVNQVVVEFDEALDPVTATDAANYYLVEQAPTQRVGESGRAAPSFSVGDTVHALGASLGGDERTVTLSTEPMNLFVPYILHVVGVKDKGGNDAVMVPNPVVDKIRSGRIYDVAGTGLPGLGGENMDPLLSHLYLVQDVAVGPDGLIYITDWNNHRIRVIEDGLIRTIIGTGILGDAEEGNALDVGLNHPTNVSFGPDGNLYMAAWHNSKIMQYDMQTKYLSYVCGWAGARGWWGDGEPAYEAIINLPSSTIWGPDGNLYISDQANFCVRMIDANSDGDPALDAKADTIVTVVARVHRAGFSGDGGPAIDARLSAPSGQSAAPASRLEFSPSGDLYLVDTGNMRVRKVDVLSDGTLGNINTVVGDGVRGFYGDGGDATAAALNFPTDVTFHPLTGNMYIADKDNHRIRMVDQAGVITTVVGGLNGSGQPIAGYSPDGTRADQAFLYEPFGICFDQQGNLYIADTKNHRVRVVYD
jgi:sugar lactone lactonase YvrE